LLELDIQNEQAMLDLGNLVANICPNWAIIFLRGNLGAGKTTFVRGFLRGLGFEGIVKSPTYTIVEPYQFEDFVVFHFDLYRIHDPQELEFIGIQEYFSTDSICLIEWPENGGKLLPPPDLSCYITARDVTRRVKLMAHSARGMEILKRLKDEI
jgi:tRNA threonylcarbamoyladenosine biosynthesis protein TsaE